MLTLTTLTILYQLQRNSIVMTLMVLLFPGGSPNSCDNRCLINLVLMNQENYRLYQKQKQKIDLKYSVLHNLCQIAVISPILYICEKNHCHIIPSYPESQSTKMFIGETIETPQRIHILKVNCCL